MVAFTEVNCREMTLNYTTEKPWKTPQKQAPGWRDKTSCVGVA
jgi:hypothetical protein